NRGLRDAFPIPPVSTGDEPVEHRGVCAGIALMARVAFGGLRRAWRFRAVHAIGHLSLGAALLVLIVCFGSASASAVGPRLYKLPRDIVDPSFDETHVVWEDSHGLHSIGDG